MTNRSSRSSLLGWNHDHDNPCTASRDGRYHNDEDAPQDDFLKMLQTDLMTYTTPTPNIIDDDEDEDDEYETKEQQQQQQQDREVECDDDSSKFRTFIDEDTTVQQKQQQEEEKEGRKRGGYDNDNVIEYIDLNEYDCFEHEIDYESFGGTVNEEEYSVKQESCNDMSEDGDDDDDDDDDDR